MTRALRPASDPAHLTAFTATATDSVDPVQQLADTLTRSRARADLYGHLLADQYAAHGLDALRTRTFVLDREGAAHPSGEQPTALARLEAEERDRVGKIAAIALRLGIEARRSAVAEAQAQQAVDAMLAALSTLNLDPARQQQVIEALAANLEAEPT